MGWIGAGVGYLLGNLIGGPFIGLITALIGSCVNLEADRGGRTRRGKAEGVEAQRLFLASLSALLAKIAKADGRVSENEISMTESIFRRLRLTPEQTRFCIEVFRRAKDDSHSIYEYATDLAGIQSDSSVREMIYALLWQMAVFDGELAPAELEILRNLPRYLGINPMLYSAYAREFGKGASPPPRDALVEAYGVVGCAPTASDGELRHVYREKVKKFHPDELQRQGMPKEMIDRANGQMARINAAYAEIKKARGIA